MMEPEHGWTVTRQVFNEWKSGVPSSLRTSLTVDQERLRLHAERSFNDGREVNRPVMSIAREAADPRAIPTDSQTPSGQRSALITTWWLHLQSRQ